MAELKDRYAGALFELSVETGMLKQHIEQAGLIQSALKRDPVEPFLVHPHIPDEAKRALLQSLFNGRISDELMGFLHLAIARSREALILPSLEAYIDKGNRHLGKTSAHVVSAAPLSEKQRLALYGMLSKKLDKQVEILHTVDPALIGGFYIHVEGRLIDRTLRTQLRNLKERLKRGGAQ
jgi:F-type H+-transporting ATPase subunit delta